MVTCKFEYAQMVESATNPKTMHGVDLMIATKKDLVVASFLYWRTIACRGRKPSFLPFYNRRRVLLGGSYILL
jgi:hypothetical protein